MFCPLDDKNVIHIPKQQLWREDGNVDGIGFKLINEHVGHIGADGKSHGCPMHLFRILTLEEEIGIFKAELQQCCDVMY